MRFENREHAARLLARRLYAYKDRNPLVLGIPRGAVPMARIIADLLGGELDIVLVRKLGFPGQPELAIGSIDETGSVYLSEHALGVDAAYIEAEKKTQLETLRRRRAEYTPFRSPIDPAGRIVIVVDNGIATGATIIAALRATRQKKPGKLIAAVAVAPPGTVARLSEEADEVVCLAAPRDFYAVGQFFDDFSQVTDEEVIAIMQGNAAKSEEARQ
jgi:predicted phosphoribosyltransferase